MILARTLPYLWYPAGMIFAAVLFGSMLVAGSPLLVALYAPILLVGSAVLILELAAPERSTWRPGRYDLISDVAFLAIVQVALPRLLMAAAVLAIAHSAHAAGPISIWPHHWSIVAQIALMVVLVDFLRYWLHRACHHFDALWRLHAVHHAPQALYALNVGRFHPLEKALQFGVDTVPFLLMGLAPEIFAGYFLIYATNGIFQHSNVRLRYGWLNYLVGSAQTHRWHHAKERSVANCNFGTSTVLWDVIFGTWYLPEHRTVDKIGIEDEDYPKGFLAQMVAPFRSGAHGAGAGPTTGRRLVDRLVSPLLRVARFLHARRIVRQSRDPMRVQRALLEKIVRANRETDFGRRHGFALVDSYESFVRRVPVSDFEALRPYVEAQIEHGTCGLTMEQPEHYARTSGSTGKPKDVPLVVSHLHALKRVHRASVAFQHRACPEAFSGSILAITSPAVEGRLANGRPYGAASGIVAGNTSALVRGKFVLAPEVLAIQDPELKYLLILRLAIARPDVTYVGTANSATLLTLLRLFREHAASLIRDVRHGGFHRKRDLSPNVWRAIESELAAQPQRASALEQIAATQRVRLADLWPQLRMVVTWTGGSAAVTLAALEAQLDARTLVFELGYVASEFRGTITLGRRAGTGWPTVDTHFFEFVERDLWDRGEGRFLTLEEIRKGIDYYVFVTTPSGLYRYFINDLVRVTGRFHSTPLLRFVQKGKGVTSITGEKLYEAQVLDAVRGVLADTGRAALFVMMLADEDARDYRLYVETDSGARPPAWTFGQAVEQRLARINVEFEAKRASGRLGRIRAAWVSTGTGAAFKSHCVQRGQREGQFKPVALAYARGFEFDLDARVEDDGQ